MEENREKVLADLYTLRAGLSFVSKKSDEVKKYERKLAKYDEEVKAVEVGLIEERKSVKTECEKLEKQIEKRNEQIESKESEIGEHQKEIRKEQRNLVDEQKIVKTVKGSWWFFIVTTLLNLIVEFTPLVNNYIITFIFGGITFIAWIFGLFAMLFTADKKRKGGLLYGLMSVGIGGVLFVINLIMQRPDIMAIPYSFVIFGYFGFGLWAFIISGFVYMLADSFSSHTTPERMVEYYLREINGLEKSILRIREEIIPLEQEKSDLVGELAEKREILKKLEHMKEKPERGKVIDKKNEYALANRNAVSEAIAIAQATIKAMEEKRTLDSRDWGNTDLIIYYYETGRADTVKEALFLVDRQKQNDALMRAIKEASDSLRYTLESGFESLGETMAFGLSGLSKQITTGFSALGGKLDMQNRVMIEQTKSMSESMRKIGEGLSDMKIESELQTSFMDKIATSSSSLARDVDYMHNIERRYD